MNNYFKGLLNTNSNSEEIVITNKRAETLDRLGVKEYQDAYGHICYRPQGKRGNTAPVIMREYYEEETKGGETIHTRMYECAPYEGMTEPVQYVADKYDEVFLPAHSKKRITAPLKGNRGNYKTKY